MIYIQGDFFKEKFQMAINEIESLKKQVQLNTNLEVQLQFCQVEKENECLATINQYNFGKNALLQPVGNIAMTLIRTVENAREINACAGMSTNFGYLTTRLGMLNYFA